MRSGGFLSASIALAIAGHQLYGERPGNGLTIAACLSALVSYGPHKYFDAAFASIWPAVLLAQLAVVSVLFDIWISRESKSQEK